MTARRGADRAEILDDAIRQFLCVADSDALRALTSPTGALELVLAAAGSLRAALDEAERAGEMGGATVEFPAEEAEAVSTGLRMVIDMHSDGPDESLAVIRSARSRLHRAVAARRDQALGQSRSVPRRRDHGQADRGGGGDGFGRDGGATCLTWMRSSG